MKVTRELEAHQIVDKNGVRRTVWKKPSLSKSERFAAIKPIIAPNLSKNRMDHELFISRAIDEFNEGLNPKPEFIRPQVQKRPLDIAISKSSDEEIRIIAEALESGDYALRNIIFRRGEKAYSFSGLVSLAAVYTPDLYNGDFNTQYRVLCINEAVRKAYSAIRLNAPDEGWSLADEDESFRERTSRLVRLCDAVGSADYEAPIEPSEELIQTMMDDSRDDHDQIISILKSDPKATMAQIEFILSGGSSSISSGML